MNLTSKLLIGGAFMLVSATNVVARQLNDIVNVNDGWKFALGEYNSDASLNDFDDRGWEEVDIPHDWSAVCDFDSLAPSGNDGGYLPAGTGWYRRSIDISDVNRRYSLIFDGVYMDSEVFVNGHQAGGHPYGYTTFEVDITPYVVRGQNIIAVKVDNSRQKNSRWYSGSGIYRNVRLASYANLHIKSGSLFISTKEIGSDVATVNVKFDVEDVRKSDGSVDVSLSVPGACKDNHFTAKLVGGKVSVSRDIQINSPALWSPESPGLYEMKIVVTDGHERFVESECFGIRKFEYSAQDGLRLNGNPITLSGACVHHDNGMLGARSYRDAEYRKARLLKDAGFNAVRTSHNPPAPEFLDACDELGLIAIDEAFDGWKAQKTPYDYSIYFDRWALADIEAMVRRDRNHPSVMAWSIGNEIIERKSPEAVEIARTLGERCRNLDPTRPVTQALASWDSDWEIFDPLAAVHEIAGYNYMIHKAEGDHQRVPERVIWQTESYPRDAFSNAMAVRNHSYIIGDFVWTGIDYLGESGIGRHYYTGDSEGEHYERNQWPWHGALCGDIDITGLRKPISYYRQMLNDTTKSYIYLAVREPDGYYGKIRETQWGTYPEYESWNWSGIEGDTVQVVVYSTYPSVQLFLNDKLVGEKSTTLDNRHMAVFDVPYAPGTIRAVADGGKVMSDAIVTASEPAKIKLNVEKEVERLQAGSLCYITATIVDADGNPVPTAGNMLRFNLLAGGKILATGSADMKDERGYQHHDRNAFRGRAQAVVLADSSDTPLTIEVSSPGLIPAKMEIPR